MTTDEHTPDTSEEPRGGGPPEEPSAGASAMTEPEGGERAAEVAAEEERKLNLEVAIDDVGPCKKHIKITIPPEDIETQYSDAFDELMENASVPGFRPGHAPRRLIERRYRKDVTDQVKAALLMNSLEQLSDEHELAVISQPDLDPLDIEMPDEGPLVYEFDVEVRPEFDLPQYRGLTIQRPVRELSEKDVDAQLQRHLARFGKLVPKDGPAEEGDFVTADLIFQHGKQEINRIDEQVVQLQPTLSFRDGNVEKFAKQMAGIQAGESRKLKAKLSPQAPNPELRGKTVQLVVEVKDVKQLELPELTEEFLHGIGFDTQDELRDAVRSSLQRRLEYEQLQSARQQVVAQITEAAQLELPEDLLQRQARSTLTRQVLEMRRAGYSEQEIRAREAQLQQDALASTAQSLKESFVLARIAEEEGVEVEPEDVDAEIQVLAAQSNETPRRVRARLEKDDLMDSLAAQIVERKAIQRVLEYAEYEDVPVEPEKAGQVEALDHAAGGEEPEEPEAEVAEPPAPES